MSRSKLRLHKSFAFVMAAAFTAGAHAQPSPGQVGDTLKKAPDLKLPQPAPEIHQQPTAPAGDNGARKVVVRSFSFSGNTVYRSEQLAPVVAKFTQHPISLMEIYDAADAVAEFYVKNGYSLASVSVPPQKISDGTIQLDISEGRVDRIDVQGNHAYKADHLRDYLSDVKTGDVYRGDALDDGMRRLNALPGLKAKAIIKPGELYGTSDIVVQTSEDPISGSMSIDNYGRKDIGQFRVSAFAQLNNPTGVEDQLQLLVLRSDQGLLNYYYANYSVPVNTDSTRLSLSYGHAGFHVLNAPVDGYNDSGKLMIEHTLLDTRRDSATVNAGVSSARTNADFGGASLSATDITLLELGATYNHVYDNLAVTQVTSSLATDFHRQDPAELTPPPGQLIKGDQRLRVEMDVQHLQPIHNRISLLARVNGVYSPDALVDPQKYAIGGPQSVRGYPASEVRGDRGILGSLTLMRPFALADVNMVGRVFIDSGRVYSVNSPADASLTSVGLGFDAQYQRINAKLDWSFPRDNHQASDNRDHSRLFGSLSVAF